MSCLYFHLAFTTVFKRPLTNVREVLFHSPYTQLYVLDMKTLLFCILAKSAASFMVSTPSDHLIAVKGHPAVLGCHFTPHPDLSSLNIVWQRQKDSQVVHRFYYEQNQLDHQSPQYHNRTSLYISELGKGNASLRIDGVGLKDVGWYLCKVNNINGAEKAKIKLDYGAFYSEPRLSIHVNSTTIAVQFETEGFPKPEVIWLDEYGQSLIHHLELHDQTEDGLYLVRSRYEAQKPAVNVTFTLKNHLLNQNLERPVIYVLGDAGDGNIALIFLSIICIILIGIIAHMMRGAKADILAKCQKHFKPDRF